jgi:two-component system, NarL family, nitrate/nitrite response regulator NarL
MLPSSKTTFCAFTIFRRKRVKLQIAPTAAAARRVAEKVDSKAIRIVIADDHRLFREALRKLLETDSRLQIVGEAGGGRDAVRLAAELRPDILLVDLCMPGRTGLDALRELLTVAPSVRTLLLTADATRTEISEALQCGARGVVLKQSASHLLFKSIHSVMAGEYWVGRDFVGQLIAEMCEGAAPSGGAVPCNPFGLTARELDIVSTIVDGYTNDAIAQKLAISSKTVKHHLTNIFNKVGVSNRIELALFAVHHHLEPAA